MEFVSDILINQYIKRNIIDESRKGLYKEGIKLILADVINILLVLAAGLILKSLIYAFLYLLVSWTVRWFSGGFHAKTYMMCRVVTVSSFLFAMVIAKLLGSYMQWLSLVFALVTLATILFFAPIKHPNKELSNNARKRGKKIALIISLIYSITSVVLCRYIRYEGFIISSSLFTVTILMYAGMMFNGKGGKNNEE